MADSPSTIGAAEDDTFTFESTANKQYPLAPEGVHDVVVARALHFYKENPFDKEKKKQHTIQMMLQSKQTYKGDDGKEVPYNLFLTMKISDHRDANMPAFFRDVLGIDIPYITAKRPDGTEAKRIHFVPPKVEQVEDGEDREHMEQFEKLEFQIVVKHEEKKDGSGKKDKVDSIIPCSAEKKAFNAAIFRAPEGAAA